MNDLEASAEPMLQSQKSDVRIKTIGLCMIVKNETKVILQCLTSVLPLIDYILIVDTGSEDGTQQMIRDFLVEHHIRGAVIDEPWRDFAYNRSFALARLREVEDVDYALIIDADDLLVLDGGFDPLDFKVQMEHDLYDLEIFHGNISFFRPQLCRNSLDFSFKGVLHEYLEKPTGDVSRSTATGFRIQTSRGGARSQNPRKYQDDAAVLERTLETETDPFLISRYTFYLAQSYRDSGDSKKAIEQYLRRAELGFWREEIYIALYQAARLQAGAELPVDEVLATYQRAIEIVPHRAEAIHGASRLCRNAGRNQEGYEIAKRGIGLTVPASGLFLEPWIYDYGLLDEFAINAYWAGHCRESLDASIKLISSPKCPEEQRARLVANARFTLAKLPNAPNLGSFGNENFVKQHALVPPKSLRSHLVEEPRVLIAILAKQKERSLPLYLECIEALDYPKSSIVLYIRTNNNTDGTERILRDWVARVGHLYAHVEFDADDVATRVEQFGVHEWNATRFRVLGRIRNISLRRTHEHECDFYFVSDVDNFIRPCTLRELIALNLPIVAPLLRSINPGSFYSNYHAEIAANGYYKACDQYHWVLGRLVRGVVEVPVVHCTYLIRADVLNDVTYEDATARHEYVVFSDSARKSNVPQYIDNRQVYGYITFDEGDSHHVANGLERARTLLGGDMGERVNLEHETQKSLAGRFAPPDGSTPVRSASYTKRPKTLIFCTSFAKTREEWNERYLRWLRAIRTSELVYDTILMVDDGSPILPDWTDVEIRTDEIEDRVGPTKESLIYHFRERLGRKAVFDFPGWYRSFAFAGRYADIHGFEKVIHIESDTFVIGSRIQRYINDATTGWTAFWCPRHSFPESAIQVIAGGAIQRFAAIERTHSHESLIGREFEHQLPFDVVERRFKGNRYGEYLPFVPGNAEYAVQVKSDQADDYYWWLKSGEGHHVGSPIGTGAPTARWRNEPEIPTIGIEQVHTQRDADLNVRVGIEDRGEIARPLAISDDNQVSLLPENLDSRAGDAGEATATREELLHKIWRGHDPFAHHPKKLYEHDAQGWNAAHRYLTEAIDEIRPGVVVEIGVWKGASAMTMARKLKELGLTGAVIAVDTWLGAWDHWTSNWFEHLSFDRGYPSIYHKFIENVMRNDLCDFVVPLPLDSVNAARVLRHHGIKPEVVHIDGGHDYTAVSSDLKEWWDVLKHNGIMIGDDYYEDGTWPEVKAAFDDFFRARGVTHIENMNGKCRIRKTRTNAEVRLSSALGGIVQPLPISAVTPRETPVMLHQVHLINLDRSTDRLEKFQEQNPHIENILRVSAVDGASVNRQELIDNGTIAEDLSYELGALGCALSHVGLWKKAVSKNRIVTIFEDDVICARNFKEESLRILSGLPEDWDIIQWGYIFDPCFLWLNFGFAKAKLAFYDRRFSGNFEEFQREGFSPVAARLAHSFGLQAYSVSPKGARALLECCLPLRKRLIPFPGTGIRLEDTGIDCAMSAAYGSMQAFLCIPPLVIQDPTQASVRKAIGT